MKWKWNKRSLIHISGQIGVKFKQNILLWKNWISKNGIARLLCQENRPMQRYTVVLKQGFDFWFQGLSIATACFLLVASFTLPDLSFPSHIPRNNNCVKRRILTASGVVAICKETSFQCFHNVGNCGLPKCQPVYEMRTYHVIKENSKVAFTQRVIANCICSKCGK